MGRELLSRTDCFGASHNDLELWRNLPQYDMDKEAGRMRATTWAGNNS
jgi:hypothetical protein